MCSYCVVAARTLGIAGSTVYAEDERMYGDAADVISNPTVCAKVADTIVSECRVALGGETALHMDRPIDLDFFNRVCIMGALLLHTYNLPPARNLTFCQDLKNLLVAVFMLGVQYERTGKSYKPMELGALKSVTTLEDLFKMFGDPDQGDDSDVNSTAPLQ